MLAALRRAPLTLPPKTKTILYNMKKPPGLFLIQCVLLLSLIFSCSRNARTAALEKTELFSLEYGGFEDEINLFYLSEETTSSTHIAMRDGFFYISNGAQQKILQLNSYGDLLSLYYNPETNLAPEFAPEQDFAPQIQGDERSHTTQRAVPYPFESPGAIAVDAQKNIYVVDTLPADRIEYDPQRNLRLSQVVLRFSNSGEFVDYLGQRGPGGLPFPWIQDIYTTKDSELVVVCRASDGMTVYWFTDSGFLRYMIHLEKSALPSPFDKTAETFMSLEKIIPDYSRSLLYLKIDYYATAVDEAAKIQSGIDYKGTFIYPMDITSESFLEPIGVPPFESSENKNLAKTNFTEAYNFLGQTDSGWFFFYIPDETGYAVQMILPRSQTVLKRHLDVDMTRLLYYSFSLSDKGILCALFADEERASIVWWRTDSVIDALHKK
jgi:hypothetical protein